MKLSVLFPFMLSILCILGACTHEPSEGPVLSKPGLPVYREAIPISEIREPGCEPQMPIDSMWHWNKPRDSNYIRDLIANPNNPNQWVYIQHVIKRGEDWNILWYVDLEKRERKQLDSSYWRGFDHLTWGGEYVAYDGESATVLYNTLSSYYEEIGNDIHPSISPNGEYLKYSDDGVYLYDLKSKTVVTAWDDKGGGRVIWHRNSTLFYDFDGSFPFLLYKISTQDFGVEKIYESAASSFGHEPFCLSHDGDFVYASGHFEIDLINKTHSRFLPYCNRQRLERAIPLKDTREYLTIKYYKETVDPYTTHVYYHFHVFDENWENERRVRLNFDF